MTPREKALLKAHRQHVGLYSRLAHKLGVDITYVGKVARGQCRSQRIEKILFAELERIQKIIATDGKKR